MIVAIVRPPLRRLIRDTRLPQHCSTEPSARRAANAMPGNGSWRPDRRQCARSPRPRLSLGVTLPGQYQPRPRLSTRHRLDQPWGAHRRLAPGLDVGHSWRRAHHAPEPLW